jgi:hypothetical protein
LEFIVLEKKRRELLGKVKLLRSGRSPALPDTQLQLEAVENRETILRRLMDGILWVLLMPKIWIAPRFAFQSEVRRPNPEELLRILSIARELNQKAKREIHLVSDLTTIVQLGDILRIRWDEEGLYLRLCEIKSGRVNDTIMDLMDTRGGTLSDADLEALETKLGRHARAQASRMLRQRERFKEFETALQSETLSVGAAEGDPLLDALAGIKPPSAPTYLVKLPELVADAKAHGIGVHGIDGCLWLVALSEKGIADILKGEIRDLPHLVFHLKHPETTCQRAEIPALKQEAPLVNLVAHNMTYVLSRSALIWYPKDLVLDVVMDRVRVYAQFDLEAFFGIAAKANLELSLITGKEAEEGKRAKTSGPMLENPRAYGVKVRFPDGRVVKLRSSLFRSVYSHLIPPSYILRLIAIIGHPH